MSSSDDKITSGGTYVVKAPPADMPDDGDDEISILIGVISACFIIAAVLFFLWKLLQRKQSEMKQLMKDVESAESDSKDEDVASTSSRETEKGNSKLMERFLKQTSHKEPQHPHRTMLDDDAEEHDKDVEEFDLSPFSPITSPTWSTKRTSISGDTGYISDLHRKSGLVRRRLKSGTDELYMEDACDIFKSLKHDRETLRHEMKSRSEKSKQAIESLKLCENFLQSARKHATVKSKSRLEMIRFLRQTREERRYNEMKRLQSKNSIIKRRNCDKKDAFIAMQDWYEGMHLHADVSKIAEEVFLLRSYHKTALDENQRSKILFKDSLDNLSNCTSVLKRVKCAVLEMKKEIRERKAESKKTELYREKKKAVLDSSRLENVETSVCKNEKPRKPRITLSKSHHMSFTDLNGGKLSLKTRELKAQDKREKCVECRLFRCHCKKETKSLNNNNLQNVAGNMAAAPNKSEIDKKNEANTKVKSPSSNQLLQSSTNEESRGDSEVQSSSASHKIVLSLSESARDHNEEQNLELSEREVERALKRVPCITSLKRLTKESETDWTIEAVAMQERIANIRFNCRGKTYVVEMKRQ